MTSGSWARELAFNRRIRRTIYEELASEYYDSERHPTCENFRSASKLYISSAIDQFSRRGLTLCEVGAGSSLLAEILGKDRVGQNTVILTDSSPSMLEYSASWRQYGAETRVTSAYDTTLPDSSVDILISSLGDPYNTSEFWLEAYRILRPGAICHFTTPSFDWAVRYRREFGDSEFDSAEFLTTKGESVSVDSFIFSIDEQVRNISSCGLRVISTRQIFVHELSGMPLSEKLIYESGEKKPVVDGYTIEKLSTG